VPHFLLVSSSLNCTVKYVENGFFLVVTMSSVDHIIFCGCPCLKLSIDQKDGKQEF